MGERTIAGKYRLEGVVGTGAFGTVFRAVHVDVGRQFAVKVLDIPEEHSSKAEAFRKRFAREAKILGQLDHPNAVQVFDFGEHEGKPYLVMEFVEGRSVLQVIQAEGRLSEPRVRRITEQLLSALSSAHALGLVHRDLKPSNIMLVGDGESEQVKVVDFGVAAAFRPDALPDAVRLSVTKRGSFVGTPRYASPEQFTGDIVAGSDVYAVGLLMWEMLVGQPAVPSQELEDCIRAHMDTRPWEVPAHVQITRGLRELIEHALLRSVSDRYEDAAEMLDALRALPEIATQPATVPSREVLQAGPGEMLVGKYRLGPVIGAGGFSRVFRAEHVDMQRTVAVKLLDLQGAVGRGGGTTAKDLQVRFSREARMVSQLRHPNTITVYDFGVDEHGRWYIVMEYVDGTNLWAAVRKQGAFEPRRAAQIARDVLRSLGEAHHLGILHRDLKPGNIMLSRDFQGTEVAKVLDFGIATVHDVGELPERFEVMRATQMGTFVGTPQYAAPEQFLGEKLTPAADLYAVGLVLWEMLAGRAAVEADAFGECLKMHMSSEPWQIPDRVPPGLSDILRGALEKRPGSRYLTAAEMADDLDGWLAGTKQDFRPAPTTEERWEPAFDYGATDQPIIDPNVDDGFVPEFLRDDADSPSMSAEPSRPVRQPASRPANTARNRKQSSGERRRRPSPARLELDYDSVPQRRQARPARPGRVHDDSRKPRIRFNRNWVIGGFVVVVLAAVAYSAMQTDSEPQVDLTEEEPMFLDLDDPMKPREQDTRKRYSTEGIVRAIRAGGWNVLQTSDSNVLTNVRQQTYRLRSGDASLEIKLITTKSTAIAQNLFEATRPPIQAVVFDNKLVRIFPPPKPRGDEVGELVALLRRYRQLVNESEGED